MKTLLLKDAVALIPNGATVMIGELAVIGLPAGRATLLETAPSVTVEQVRDATDAEHLVSERVCAMVLWC